MAAAPPSVDALRSIGAQTKALSAGTFVWRIHNTGTAHPMAWNRLRTWGPLPSARWDPHPEPAADAAPLGAAYFGLDVPTCLAEVFQESRFIDVDRGAPYLTGFRLARDIELIDVTGNWLLTAGALASVALGDRNITRAWARSIHDAWPGLDGVYSISSPLGKDHLVVTVWTDVFPPRPEFSVPLNSPAIAADIAAAAKSFRFDSNLII